MKLILKQRQKSNEKEIKYEDYKKVGAMKKNEYLTNQITSKQFENWIESTKSKK